MTIGPTSTVVLSLDVRDEEWLTVQVANLDATQTVRCYVERRQSEAPWGLSTVGTSRRFRRVALSTVTGTRWTRPRPIST